MKLKAFCCALIISCLPAQGWALSLDSFLSSLETHYPPLQEAALKVEQTQSKLLEKQGNFDTKFKGKWETRPLGYYRNLVFDQVVEQATPWWGARLFSGYRLGTGDFADYDGKKKTLSLGEFRVGASLPLLRDRTIDPVRAELAIFELQVGISELDLRRKQLDIFQKAIKAYWGWVAAHHKREVLRELVALTEKRLVQLAQEIKEGKKAAIELTENQRALLNRKGKLVENELKLQEKQLELSAFAPQLQLKDVPDFPDTRPCQPVVPDSLMQQVLRQRPETHRLQLQQEQNRIARELVDNQFLPQVDSYVMLSQDWGEGEKSYQPLEVDIGLSWEWPVQMRKAEGQRQYLTAEQNQLQLQNQFWNISLRNELQTTAAGLKATCEGLALAQAEIKVAQTLVDAELKRFDLGASDLLVVNLREQSLADAQSKWIEAQESYFYLQSLFTLQQGLLPVKLTRTGS